MHPLYKAIAGAGMFTLFHVRMDRGEFLAPFMQLQSG